MTQLAEDNTIELSGIVPIINDNGPIGADTAATLSSTKPDALLTITITISDPTLGAIWNIGNASVSNSGSVVLLRGSTTTLQAFLNQITFVPASGVSGAEFVTVSVTDGVETVSSNTSINVEPAYFLGVSNIPVNYISAPLTIDSPYQDVILTDNFSPSATHEILVSLSGGPATLLAGGGGTLSDGNLVDFFSGTASQLQTALRDLQVSVPASASPSTETLTLNINGLITNTTLKIGSTDTVFVGATDSTDGLYASSSISAPLLATGKIGLFDDYNGITGTVIAGSSASLQTKWTASAPGIFGYSEGSDVAQQTITIKNTGTSAITVPVGTLASTSSGVQFQVIKYNGSNPNWSAGTTGDGTLGVYTITAGSSVTVPVEALAQGYVGNVAVNTITQLGSGIAQAVITSSAPSLLATEYASGTITLTNTTGSSIVVYENTTVTNASGIYVIGNNPAAAYFSDNNTDGSAGVYTIAAGGSTTVPIFGVDPRSANAATGLAQIMAQTTNAANTITSTALPIGIKITGSSTIGLSGPSSAAQGAAWGTWGAGTGVLTDRGFGAFLAQQGFTPSEGNTNLNLTTEFTNADLTSWDGYVDTLRALGVMNIAPVVNTQSLVLDVSASDATAELRSAALYGGGLDIDMTPSMLLSLGASALTAVVDDIKWAAANGLRSTLTLRAYTDPSFMQNTQRLLTELQAAGALPSQVVVIGSPSLAAPANTELANSVAQYVASLNLTPSTSESGLETTGGSTVDLIMTGVKPTETVSNAVAAPYAGVQVFAHSPSDQITAVIALNDPSLGVLSTSGGAGIVSPDGSTITLTGTPAAITNDLAAVDYIPAAEAVGTLILGISLLDRSGAVEGQTVLDVSNLGLPIPLTVAPLSDSNGVTTISVTDNSPQDILVATAGGTVTDGTFQVSGTPVNDEVALNGLDLASGSGSAPNLDISISGSPTTFIDRGMGTDTIDSAGGNVIQAAAGDVYAGLDDTISAGVGSLLVGSSQTYTFIGGSSAADTVVAGDAGSSFTAGTGGGSLLIAGTGSATLRAAGANDTLIGGGNTALYGSPGKATILDASDGDTAFGADGSILNGPPSGIATLLAQGGNETIIGGAGAFNAVLGSGNVSISGGSGNESIVAGLGGKDIISVGTGNEVLYLQQGISTGAQITVNDFLQSHFSLSLKGYNTTPAQLAQTQVATSSGTMLSLSDGTVINFIGLTHVNLT